MGTHEGPYPQAPPAPATHRPCGADGSTEDRRPPDVRRRRLVSPRSPSGAKSWILRTVIKGRRCDLGLGSVTLVSLAEAREQAVHLRKVARTGGDPLVERRRVHRWLPTFEEAARQVHAAHAAGFRNEKHRKQWLASLTDVVAAFGAKRVDAITSADILTALGPHWLARRQPRGGCSNGSG